MRDSPPRQWQSMSPSEEEAVLFLFLKDPTSAPLKHNTKASTKSNDRNYNKMVGRKNKRKENGVSNEMKLGKKYECLENLKINSQIDECLLLVRRRKTGPVNISFCVCAWRGHALER